MGWCAISPEWFGFRRVVGVEDEDDGVADDTEKRLDEQGSKVDDWGGRG